MRTAVAGISWICALTLTAVASSDNTQRALTFTSPSHQVHLLELYTSQGCSSCPPAERWVSELHSEDGLWRRFVPIVFHVDYWDYLGWKDILADPSYTVRQRAYARAWRADTVYTPMFVLDGQAWRARNVKHLRAAGNKAGILRGTRRAGSHQWELTFVSHKPLSSPPVFHAALLGTGIETHIRAGENHGRTLRQDFVVLDTTQTPSRQAGDTYRGTLTLTPNPQHAASRLAVALWVTEKDSPALLQATGGWITDKQEEERQ